MSSLSEGDAASASASAGMSGQAQSNVLPYRAPAEDERRAPRKIGLLSMEAWTPLAVPLFRWLWIATAMNYIATAARDNAGSPWLMKKLAEGRTDKPFLVSLVITASTLPICLLSPFAGALADLMDRRRLLILTQLWMVFISVVLAAFTWTGYISPWGLLGLTLLLAVGTAASNPAFQAVLPELVPPKDISLAMGLNSVALNLGRALGPALFGLIMFALPGKHGIATTFLIIAATFIGVTWVLYLWKRPMQRAAVQGEQFWGALKSGLQYTAYSPANRAILLRVFTFIVPALALWAQFPTIAERLHQGASGFSGLLIFLGAGAILGVFMMQEMQRRFSIDGAVNGCTAMFAFGLILLPWIHHVWLADVVMFFLGINWVIVPTNFNVATQTSVPAWVKGRALSLYLTVLWGSFALGGPIWGRVTEQAGLATSLTSAGLVMLALLLLAKWFPLTLNRGVDFAPAGSGGAMTSNEQSSVPAGPVRVTARYVVPETRGMEFRALMRKLAQQRRRNGAWGWTLETLAQSVDGTIGYLEQYHFSTGAEYSRQPARMTRGDLALLEEARAFNAHGATPSETIEEHTIAPRIDRDRMIEHAWNCLDRTLEECEISFRRLKQSNSREAARRRSRSRTLNGRSG